MQMFSGQMKSLMKAESDKHWKRKIKLKFPWTTWQIPAFLNQAADNLCLPGFLFFTDI